MDFIGNPKIFALLEKSLKSGALNQAYIFSGPEHVGKFTLAKMFALHAISGTQLDTKIDNFSKDALLDLLVIAPEILEKNNISKKRDISIESIREARKNLSLFPYQGKYKVMVVDDAQKMNVSAQNALLKILEEPNPTTMIILVTPEIDKILPTVQSRCQTMNFNLAGDAEMRKAFSQELISLAAGRPGLAKIMEENDEERIFRSEAINDLNKIITGSLNEKFALAEEFSKDIVKTSDKLNFWLWEMRKKALLSGDSERKNIYASMENIQKSMAVFKNTNANARLILETLFMDM
jgi:DNA polymerase III subunit delta'